MTLLEIKNVVKSTKSEVKALSDLLIQAVISTRIEELKARIEVTDNKKEIESIKKTIKILQKPIDQEFYLNIEKAAINSLNLRLEEVCENISIDLINAEYFKFSGRLK